MFIHTQFTIKVVRVETNDGQRLVGILIPNENAEMIKETILKDVRKLVESGASPGAKLEQPEKSTPSVETDPSPLVVCATAEVPQQTNPADEEVEELLRGGGTPAGEDEVELEAESDDDVDMDGAEEHTTASKLSAQPDDNQVHDCDMLSVGAVQGNEAPAGVLEVVVGAQDCGDETEDDSDVETECQQTAQEERASNNSNDTLSTAAPTVHVQDVDDELMPLESAAAAKEATAAAQDQNGVASCGTTRPSLRDSILSNSDTPQKDHKAGTSPAASPEADNHATRTGEANTWPFSPLCERGKAPGAEQLTDEAAPSSSKAPTVKKLSLKARLPAPEDDGCSDEMAVGDEKAIQDAEAKSELLQPAKKNAEQQGNPSKSKTAELEASGLWELDDDAEEFFAQGLKILEEARRKDECVRRRYTPSQAKGSKEKKKVPAADSHAKRPSRSDRLRKQTNRFADSKMKGQRYVCDDGGTEDDNHGDGTETESDEDADTSSAGQGSKREDGSKSAREGEGQARVRKPRMPKQRQVASAVMVDKALKEDADARKVRFNDAGKLKLKELANNFLGGLLGRPELCGKMSERAVKQAIRTWIPYLGGVGDLMRCEHTCVCTFVRAC
jgi:hypothetical protein